MQVCCSVIEPGSMTIRYFARDTSRICVATSAFAIPGANVAQKYSEEDPCYAPGGISAPVPSTSTFQPGKSSSVLSI